jgi:hypothetical protein
MPEVSKTEVGRRLFQVHKEKGVETAMKKIHQGIGDDWKILSEGDMKVLKRILGECWVYTDRDIWEKIAFTKLRLSDVLRIIQIGNSGRGKDSTDTKAIDDVTAILTGMI